MVQGERIDEGRCPRFLKAIGIPWQIFEQGLNPETHQWASDYLFLNEGFVNVTIPSCIEAGQYLLRVESICQSPHPIPTHPLKFKRH